MEPEFVLVKTFNNSEPTVLDESKNENSKDEDDPIQASIDAKLNEIKNLCNVNDDKKENKEDNKTNDNENELKINNSVQNNDLIVENENNNSKDDKIKNDLKKLSRKESNRNNKKDLILKIKFIPLNALKSEIINFFRGCKFDKNKVHMHYVDGKFCGQAFIEFENNDDILKAFDYDCTRLRQRDRKGLQLFRANKEEFECALEDTTVVNELFNEFLKVKSIPNDTTKKDIENFFKGCSIAEDGIILIEHRYRLAKECYVHFETLEDARMGILKNGEPLKSRYVEVYKSSRTQFKRMANYMLKRSNDSPLPERTKRRRIHKPSCHKVKIYNYADDKSPQNHLSPAHSSGLSSNNDIISPSNTRNLESTALQYYIDTKAASDEDAANREESLRDYSLDEGSVKNSDFKSNRNFGNYSPRRLTSTRRSPRDLSPVRRTAFRPASNNRSRKMSPYRRRSLDRSNGRRRSLERTKQRRINRSPLRRRRRSPRQFNGRNFRPSPQPSTSSANNDGYTFKSFTNNPLKNFIEPDYNEEEINKEYLLIVKVKNLSDYCKKEDLFKFFEDNDILPKRVVIFTDRRNSSQEAKVYLRDIKDAKKSWLLNGMNLMNKKIDLITHPDLRKVSCDVNEVLNNNNGCKNTTNNMSIDQLGALNNIAKDPNLLQSFQLFQSCMNMFTANNFSNMCSMNQFAAAGQNYGLGANGNQNYGLNLNGNTQNYGLNLNGNNQNFGLNTNANTQNFGLNSNANFLQMMNHLNSSQYNLSSGRESVKNENFSD